MEILGIGPLELILILLIALIVMGPKDLAKAGKTIGYFMRKIVTSPNWNTVRRTSREIRNLPNRLIREAGMDEELQKIQEGLYIPDLDRKILDPQYLGTPQNKPSPLIKSTPSTAQEPAELSEPDSWTSNWDQAASSRTPPAPPDSPTE